MRQELGPEFYNTLFPLTFKAIVPASTDDWTVIDGQYEYRLATGKYVLVPPTVPRESYLLQYFPQIGSKMLYSYTLGSDGGLYRNETKVPIHPDLIIDEDVIFQHLRVLLLSLI